MTNTDVRRTLKDVLQFVDCNCGSTCTGDCTRSEVERILLELPSTDAPKFYAGIEWAVADVQVLRPDLTDDEAEQFLVRNETRLRDHTISHGWDVLQRLLDLDEELPAADGTSR